MNEKTKRLVLVALLVVSLIPAFLLIPFPASITTNRILLWLADSFGYAGIVLLLWMYILGTKSVMGILFDDLAPILSIHKWLGKYGTLAIFAHPILITICYGESWLYSIIPKFGSVFERHVTLGQIAFFIIIFTWFTSWFLKGRMAFRPWKYLHYLSYIAVPFALLHVPDVGSNYLTREAVKIYFFILVVTFIIFCVLRLRGFLNLDKSPYRVLSHTRLNETDYILNLQPTSTQVIRPERGQYVYLKLGIISEDHPFSVLQYDPATNNLAVGYRVFGSYTDIMARLKPGDRVWVGGPYGRFMAHINESARPIVYLAGGIGITPFVDEIFHLSRTREQWLFAANRSRETAVLVPETSPALPGRLISVFNITPPDAQPSEETGFITEALLKKYLGDDLSRYDFYMCGPPPMMKAMTELTHAAGVPASQVQSEKFGW